MKIGKKEFDIENETYIAGILNVTPDSFSDGGCYQTVEAALARAEQMIADGADLIDVGGESTRPGYTPISDEEEIKRVTPVIAKIKSRFDIPVSIDTYKGNVAEAALESGADLVNDIWGLRHDDKIARVIKRHNAACCLMHNRKNTVYEDFLTDVCEDLMQSVSLALGAGIARERMILDPGIGFAKSYEQNLLVLNNLKYFHKMGLPLLLGTSRKSVIGLALDLQKQERVEGTLVTTILAVQAGYAFVRVHDVKENKRVVRMLKTIEKTGGV
ncbi:MAG: dihydropteroate synthase [Lachnospiraceae bacterium]